MVCVASQHFSDILLNAVETINQCITDYVLIFLLLGVGIWFTIRTRFVQIRCFGEGMRRVFGNLNLFGAEQESGMSSFQALATAIAAQVGTGNIVGASGAILLGGPGAIFWMWVVGFFGMATIYAEAVLAQKTRIKGENGEILGGPIYYIREAFKGVFGKFLAGFFAVAIVVAFGFFGCMVQANSIGQTCNTAFGIPTWVVGGLLVVVCATVFVGGVQRLASVVEKVVPIMAALFFLLALIVIIARIQYLPETIGMIFRYAFEPQAIVGGGSGAALKSALSQGAKRGLFSNEAGAGSTPHAHALANVKHPHDQGVVAIIGVFIDTFVVVSLNAIVIISTMYTSGAALANGYRGAITQTIKNTNLTQTAFGSVFGTQMGAVVVAVMLFFFVFSTILSWNFFGRVNIIYLVGTKARMVYTGIALAFIFLGTIMSNELVWKLSDLFNQLMVLPNAIALLALSGLVSKLLREGRSRARQR